MSIVCYHLPAHPSCVRRSILRRIVPAVAFAGHGLAEFAVFHELYEFYADVMAALVAVDDGFLVQRDAVFLKLAVYQILGGVVCPYCLLYPTVRICFSDRTEKAVFSHEPPGFLHIHPHADMQKSHMDSVRFLSYPNYGGGRPPR